MEEREKVPNDAMKKESFFWTRSQPSSLDDGDESGGKTCSKRSVMLVSQAVRRACSSPAYELLTADFFPFSDGGGGRGGAGQKVGNLLP